MKIVLLDAYAANPGDLSWDGLREFGEVTVYDRTAPKDVLARIGDAEVVYVNKVRLDEQTLRQCENLKLVSVLATGYNVVDTAAAKELGILVCNSPSYSTASVAQLTIAHLLELCRDACTILTGPSVPMCPALLDFGIDRLAGLVITEHESADGHVRTGAAGHPYGLGRSFLLKK